GNCRRTQGGVMCPSYMVTREEKHSTRGRAHLLWEMLNGEELELWRSEEVLDALDLCLSCKGCTNDCPVNVDMPTYKAEFLHHHYKSLKRWRPRYAYAFGLIDQAARVASKMPGVVNFLTQTPPFSRLAKLVAGMDARRVPRRDPRGHADRRDGALLPRRLQGRAEGHAPARRRRRPAGAQRLPLERVLRSLRRARAQGGQGGRAVGALPPQGHRWDGP